MGVWIKCIKCNEESEVDYPVYQQMKRDGLILNPSHRGRVKSINCCSKKAPSRGKPKKESKPSKPTKKPEAKPAKKKSKPTSTRAIGSDEIFVSKTGDFPKTLKIDGKTFHLAVPYTKYADWTVKNLLKLFKVDARVVSDMEATPTWTPNLAVYVDKKKFEYITSHIAKQGYIIVYKDLNATRKEIVTETKSGKRTLKFLFRMRGTEHDISRKLEAEYPDVYKYNKFKVFELGGKYLPRTYDIFADEKSKGTKPKLRLSRDYKKFCDLHSDRLIPDPHCSDCTVESCENFGMGDDACPAGFRM